MREYEQLNGMKDNYHMLRKEESEYRLGFSVKVELKLHLQSNFNRLMIIIVLIKISSLRLGLSK